MTSFSPSYRNTDYQVSKLNHRSNLSSMSPGATQRSKASSPHTGPKDRVLIVNGSTYGGDSYTASRRGGKPSSEPSERFRMRLLPDGSPPSSSPTERSRCGSCKDFDNASHANPSAYHSRGAPLSSSVSDNPLARTGVLFKRASSPEADRAPLSSGKSDPVACADWYIQAYQEMVERAMTEILPQSEIDALPDDPARKLARWKARQRAHGAATRSIRQEILRGKNDSSSDLWLLRRHKSSVGRLGMLGIRIG